GAVQASAQGVSRDTSAATTLTIDQAIELARRNNPELQQTLNNRINARAAVRSAYGALLPSADASFSVQRQQGGQQIFSGTSLGASSDVNQSNYQIGLNYRINSGTLITPSLQRANRDAVEADITGASETLRNNVRQQYLSSLQAEANADLQDSLVVASQQELILALRSREHVADLNVRREKGEYSPTLTLSTGVGGYTYGYANSNFPVQQAAAQLDASRASCIRTEEVRAALSLSNQLAECNAMAFTSAEAQAIRDSNAKFPFNFTKSPRSISATLSLPLFDGFAREQRLQEAMASRSDARYSVRARELALTADVTAAYLTL